MYAFVWLFGFNTIRFFSFTSSPSNLHCTYTTRDSVSLSLNVMAIVVCALFIHFSSPSPSPLFYIHAITLLSALYCTQLLLFYIAYMLYGQFVASFSFSPHLLPPVFPCWYICSYFCKHTRYTVWYLNIYVNKRAWIQEKKTFKL